MCQASGLCFRSCGSSRRRRQSYRSSVMSRNKPSRRWVCTSASKKPTALVCHPRQRHRAPLPLERRASLPLHPSSPRPVSFCPRREGQSGRHASYSRGTPCPGSQASGTQHWFGLINSSRTAFCGDRKSYGHKLSVCVPMGTR